MQISYKDAITGQRWMADRVNEDDEVLCISKREGYFYIFSTITGKPYIKARFTTKAIAMQMGQMLHNWYGEYFWILNDPDWRTKDIPSLVRYTIPNGERKDDLLKGMTYETILYDLRMFEGL
jgi:hypothetical protein